MKKPIDISAELGIPPLPSQSPDTIAAVLWAREVLQNHLTTTYAVTDPKGIEELKSVKIGGIDQWLHIRGRNRNNPVLLYVHGGPAVMPWIGTMDATQRPWEDFFTVVQWDQRGPGKSYQPASGASDPTVDRLIEDAEEVVQYLSRYLNQDKLFLMGHSWGTVTGMHLAKRHPEWFHAYIGVAQAVDMMAGERVLYERLLSRAQEHQDDKLLAELETISTYPDPENAAQSFAENHTFVRRELSRLAGEAVVHHYSFDSLIKMMTFDLVISPHRTLTDLSNAIIGDEPALIRPPYTLAKDVMRVNLPKDIGSSFEVPIFFFTGSHDWHTPFTLSDEWFEQIEAPHKELIHFKESSHMIVNEEPGKVLAALINQVLPMAESGTVKETGDD